MRFCFFSYPVMREAVRRERDRREIFMMSRKKENNRYDGGRLWANLQRLWKTRADAMILAVGAMLLAVAAVTTSVEKKEKKETAQSMTDSSKTVIVIDAGHGGRDGGKVSVDNINYEKDINLKIAAKLKSYMEAEGIVVIMTREADEGLYVESDSNKKAADLRRRIEIIDQASPRLVVSIHQNSYHEAYVRGAQTFYYSTSTEGKKLAEIIQEQLRISLDPGNGRQAKENSSYYLLKKTSAPIVIVECGFLSNPEEAALLASDDYQDRLAFQIHLGIMQYLNQNKKKFS